MEVLLFVPLPAAHITLLEGYEVLPPPPRADRGVVTRAYFAIVTFWLVEGKDIYEVSIKDALGKLS